MAEKQAAANKSKVELSNEKSVKQKISDDMLGVEGIIRLEPIVRRRGKLYDGKESQFLTEKSYISYAIMNHPKRRTLINPFDEIEGDGRSIYDRKLNKEEQEQLASFFGVDVLQFNPNHANSFWKNRRVKVGRKGIVLHMDRLEDFVTYRLLRSNINKICLGLDNVNNSQEYRFVFVNEDEEKELRTSKDELTKRSWIEFGKLESSEEKMFDYLLVNWFNDKRAKKPTKDMKLNDLRILISDIIHSRPEIFLRVLSDPNYDIKVKIQKGVIGNIVSRNNDWYVFEDFAGTLDEFVLYLKDNRNQETKAKLMALTK